MDTIDALKSIAEQAAQAEAHLLAIYTSMSEIEDAGMYPALPTESFERKKKDGGPRKYLYMRFEIDPQTRRYRGPDGKRRLYVGCKPGAIAEARRLAENRRRYDELMVRARHLDRWIDQTKSEMERAVAKIEHLATLSAKWPQSDLDDCPPLLRPQPPLPRDVQSIRARDLDLVANAGPQELGRAACIDTDNTL